MIDKIPPSKVNGNFVVRTCFFENSKWNDHLYKWNHLKPPARIERNRNVCIGIFQASLNHIGFKFIMKEESCNFISSKYLLNFYTEIVWILLNKINISWSAARSFFGPSCSLTALVYTRMYTIWCYINDEPILDKYSETCQVLLMFRSDFLMICMSTILTFPP